MPTYIAANVSIELAGTGVDSEIDRGIQEEGTQDDKVVEIRTYQTNYPGINEWMNEWMNEWTNESTNICEHRIRYYVHPYTQSSSYRIFSLVGGEGEGVRLLIHINE